MLGDHVPLSHHIDVILECFPSNYVHVIVLFESKFDILNVYEVEVLLLAHDPHLKNYKKETFVSLNLTHVYIKFTSADTSHSLSKDLSMGVCEPIWFVFERI